MDSVDIDLQNKIDALSLHPVNDTIYNKYLEPMENIGMNVTRFKYYKLYGQYFIPYSKEYLISSTIKELLKKDKENYKQFCPSFFVRLIRKVSMWNFKRKLNRWEKNQSPPSKN